MEKDKKEKVGLSPLPDACQLNSTRPFRFVIAHGQRFESYIVVVVVSSIVRSQADVGNQHGRENTALPLRVDLCGLEGHTGSVQSPFL